MASSRHCLHELHDCLSTLAAEATTNQTELAKVIAALKTRDATRASSTDQMGEVIDPQ